MEDEIFGPYGLNIDNALKIHSSGELLERHKFLSGNHKLNNILNYFKNNNVIRNDIVYFVYTVITVLESIDDTVYTWSDYSENIDQNFYKTYLTLTDGQFKLLINFLIEYNDNDLSNFLDTLLNVYQLIYVNYLLENDRWDISCAEKNFNNEELIYTYSNNTDFAFDKIKSLNYNDFEKKQIFVNIMTSFCSFNSYEREPNSPYNEFVHGPQLIQLFNAIILPDILDKKLYSFISSLRDYQLEKIF